MATIERTSDAIKTYMNAPQSSIVEQWDSWWSTGSSGYITVEDAKYGADYVEVRACVLRFPASIQGELSSFTFSTQFRAGSTDARTENAELVCQLFTEDYFETPHTPEWLSMRALASQTVKLKDMQAGGKSFTFSNLSIDNTLPLYVLVWVRANSTSDSRGALTGCYHPSNSTANVSVPGLTLSVTPSTVVLGSSVRMDFTNRLGQSLTVTYKSGSTTLGTDTVTSDTFTKTPPASWYETAGQTGSNLSVSVSAADQYGRTASGSFTIQKPQPLTVSATAPRSTTKDGGESIQFAWEVSGTWGTQTIAELQYSTDNINWNALATVNSSATTTIIPAKTLPPGTIYWRMRVLSSYSVWSNWSSSVNFTVAYAATSYVEPMNSPTGGYIDATIAQAFGVSMQANGTPYVPFTVASAVLHWRSRTSDPWTDVPMTPDGTTASVTIPANTFPAGALYWYASAVDQYGTSSQTETYTVTTLAASIDAQPILPSGTIENKSTPTVFTWRYATITGSEQAAAELQYSTNGVAWVDLGSVTGTATTYTAPADAMPSGTIYWRVRAENADGVWGPWSSAASFINLGAPDVQSVQTDAKPFATITWQVTTQQAYRITVDGQIVVQGFGSDVRSYKLMEPLSDGPHTVSIEAQNEYEQWSAPKGTSFTVTNVPGTALILSKKVHIDAQLTWTGGNGTGAYTIYRDNTPIGKTTTGAFTDRLCLGEHSYFVIEPLPGGYYNKSNVVTADISVCIPQIAALTGGPWVPMTKCREMVKHYRKEREKALMHFRGLRYPVVEWGEFWDESVEINVLFENCDTDADALDALCGSTVIVKDPDGRLMIGALSSLGEDSEAFHRYFKFTAERVEWEDFVDATT